MSLQSTTPSRSEPISARTLQRRDAWWLSPAAFFVVFTSFGLWATFRAFQGAYFQNGNYLSPFYSPQVPIHWQVMGYPISPALYILVFPLSFRLTCYYYRKSIYRSYLADPAGCAVAEPAFLNRIRFLRYTGERAFPFFAMNFHRYAFYAASIFILFLWKDTFDAFFFAGADHANHFGIGVGSLVFLTNIVLLSTYTFSCHSWRHLIGGHTDCYSCSALNRTKFGLWQKVSFLNERHGLWAMLSLFSVALTDLYVFLLSTNHVTDLRLF